MQLLRKPTVSLVNGEQSEREREAKLIGWIAKGDGAAFREFHEATNGLLFGLLLRMLGETQIAEEVLAELYEEVRLSAARFGRQNERPLTWLIFIAHRRATEFLCRKLPYQRQIAIRSINITEQRRHIRGAMDSIPDLQQRIVEMAFFSGMTSLEISKELGQPPEQVEAELRHAILRLFQLFRAMGFSALKSPESSSLRPPGSSK
jgi:RNA polymerase sigma-70 factor (ECF subfamily)